MNNFEMKKKNISDQVVDWLRQAIISGHFESGERLIETSIAEELGVSRVPVRYAINQLENEGVIVESDVRGFEVWTVTKEDFDEIWKLRFTLEILAYENIKEGLVREEYEMLRDQVVDMKKYYIDKDYSNVFHKDRLFHEKIIKLSHMNRVASLWTQIMTQWEMILNFNTKLALNIPSDEFERDHISIVEALYYKNIDEAKEFLLLHLRKTQDVFMNVISYLEKSDN